GAGTDGMAPYAHVAFYVGTSRGDGTFSLLSEQDTTWEWDQRDRAMVADINGDGRMDVFIAHYHPSHTTGITYPHISFASALTTGQNTFELVTDDNSGWAWDRRDRIFVNDCNGDGRGDVVRVAREPGGDGVAAYDHLKIQTVLSNGYGRFPTALSHVTRWGWDERNRITLGDVDGDGKLDIMMGTMRGPQGDEHIALRTIRSNWGFELLTQMTTPIGGRTTVEYLPSSTWNNSYLPVGMV